MKIFLFAFLISSIDAFAINCVFVNMAFPSLGLTYTCMVHPSLSVTSPNQQVVTAVRGVHLAGRSNRDVRMVNFHGVDDIVVVPRGMSNFFTNLHGIRIYDSDVRNLNGNELNEYTNLRWFGIIDSYVNRIPGNFFSRNSNLIYVSFDENYVRQVGSDLFKSINNVRGMNYIGFRRNICINQSANTPAQIDRLLEHLSIMCSDSSTGTTSSPGGSTTSSGWTFSRSTSGSSSPVFTTSRSTSSTASGSQSSSSHSFSFSRSTSGSNSGSSTRSHHEIEVE